MYSCADAKFSLSAQYIAVHLPVQDVVVLIVQRPRSWHWAAILLTGELVNLSACALMKTSKKCNFQDGAKTGNCLVLT